MSSLNTFASTAKSLARNPLGIIALFIVLIYALATLVFVTGSKSLTAPSEKLPLVWFMVVFPIVVLGTFAWLVARHHKKLYGPGDYSNCNEEVIDAFLNPFGPGVSPPPAIANGTGRFATSDKSRSTAPPDDKKILDDKYDEVIQSGFCLLHAAKVIRERTNTREGAYQVRAWIESFKSKSLADIDTVMYHLWPDFDETVITTKSKKTNFDLWMTACGEYPILALAKLKNGETFFLHRYVDLPGRPTD